MTISIQYFNKNKLAKDVAEQLIKDDQVVMLDDALVVAVMQV